MEEWNFGKVVLTEIEKSGKIVFSILDDDIPESIMQYYLGWICDDNDNHFKFNTKESVYTLKGFIAEHNLQISLNPVHHEVSFFKVGEF